jgi:glutaminase
VNSTGLPFDSLEAIERMAGGRTNPMVNSGAIATTSLAPGATAEARWEFLHDGLSRFAGRRLSLDEDVYRSASATNLRNRSIAELLARFDLLSGDPGDALDLYTRQSALSVTGRDLAAMGAIGGGVVTVSPGKGGLGTFAPRLDEAGNSVKGQLVARDLSRDLGLDLFASKPEA